MRQYVLCALSLLFLTSALNSQQLPIFSQYRENQAILNSAAFNTDYLRYWHNLSAGVSYRTQWTGAKLNLDNGDSRHFGPKTITGRFEWIFPEKKFFVGGFIMDDETGPVQTTGGYLRAGYVISDNPLYGGISIGLTGGLIDYRIDLVDPTLYNYSVQYDVASDGMIKKLYPDIGLGVYFYKVPNSGSFDFWRDDIFYVGFSIPQFFGLVTDESGSISDDIKVDVYPYFALLGGWYKFIGDSFLELSGSAKLLPDKTSNIDFLARYQYKSVGWIGMGFNLPADLNRKTHDADIKQSLRDRTFEDIFASSAFSTGGGYFAEKSLLLEAGFYLGENIDMVGKNFKLGFGYGFSFGTFDKLFDNTFEFNLTYTMNTQTRK